VEDFLRNNKSSPSDFIDEYTNNVFVWLDILGFSQIVEDDTKYRELLSLLNNFQKNFKDTERYNMSIISDGIIIEINTNLGYPAFSETLKKLGTKQLGFIIKNGYFIRGGIAVGNKLVDNTKDNTRFISNGLARAVTIEGKMVNHPLIGTNERTTDKIREIFTIKNKDEFFGLKKTFNVQGEKLYYIDFLDNIDESNKLPYYNLLCKNIKENQAPNKGHILNKYLWLLRHYHEKIGKEPMCPLNLWEAI
jgi:hypothetical protein